MADKETRDVPEFMATALKLFEQDVTDEKDIRDEALADLKFAAGDQWDEKVKANRTLAGRPSLTFNRCHTFVQQVANEARQNKPQIKFVPAEDEDKDTAEIYEGLARHIQYDSDAQVAYETGVEYSAGGSFGYYGFITEYCDDESFDQDLKVRTFPDPFAVYGILIPSCLGVEPKHAFVTTHMSRKEYEASYPKSDVASLAWTDAAKQAPGWQDEDQVRVAEYWVVEETPKELTKGGKTRTVQVKTVKCYTINGIEILDTKTWAGSSIPIIPILGKQLIIEGKPRLFSVIRFQRAPQELINYYKSRIAETLGTSPIQPYLADPKQIAGYEKIWAEMGTRNHTVLPFKRIVDGQDLGVPQRQVFEAPIGSLSEAAAQEIDDMKATAGIFDASLGSKGNESSGIAIQRRQQQSNVTNMHFMDNLERAFKKGGVVIAEVIDAIYDMPRRIRILGADETPKIVAINQRTKDGKEYKFGAAKFDVLVTMGKAFSSKRMESFDMMSSIIQASPDILPMVGDIFFANSDMAGSDQLAERFKKMLPPNLQDQKEGEEPDPAQIKAQADQLAQQNQQLVAALQEAQNPLKVKEMEAQSTMQAKQADAQMAQAKMQHEREMAQAQMSHELQLKQMELKAKVSGEVMKHDTTEAVAEHSAEAAMALKVYETEAMLKSKEIDRDQAQQVQEAKEADATAKALKE